MKRLRIRRSLLERLDDEVIVQDLGAPISDKTRAPKTAIWDIYTANAHLPRAQVTLAAIADAITEVLNGGLFQLIMNPAGAFIPDLPGAFRDLRRADETRIFERVRTMFPSDTLLRDYEKRLAFASRKIVPGGWDGLAAGKSTKLYRELETLEIRLARLMQSKPFFRAVATFVEMHPESFEIVDG